MGWRLNRRLKVLRDSHDGFAAAVAELNLAAQRAEQGLADLRAATDEATDFLSDRIDKGRALAAKLEKLVRDAPAAARAEPAAAPALARSAAPVMPPLGYMMMLAWRLMRPGLLPLWAGLPLGAFDDLFSGQPFGSGVLLFSLTLIAAELLDARFPWRSFWQDWIIASGIVAAYLAVAALFSGARIDMPQLTALLPQLLLSVLTFPIIARMVSLLDRLRLLRVRRLG